jgi:Right handed beta helix region
MSAHLGGDRRGGVVRAIRALLPSTLLAMAFLPSIGEQPAALGDHGAAATLSTAAAHAGPGPALASPAAGRSARSPSRPARPARKGSRVVLRPDRIDLYKHGRKLDTLRFDGRDTTLPRVAAAVASSRRPHWLAEVRPGVFLVRATLMQAPGTRLVAAAPAVREVRLASPGRGIRARQASATFEGVRVLSWDRARRGPVRDPSARRAALVYVDGSALRLARSELAWLGTTRPGGNTGVTWAAASGTAVDSRFHHNAAGAEVLHGARVSVIRSTIEDNAGHGLVVSGPGAAPAVQRNLVQRNGGDGVVLVGVDGLLVWGNVVRANRVGIRAGRHSRRARIESNFVAGNRRGIEIYDGSRDTMLTGNLVTGSAEAGIVLEGPASLSRADQVRDTPVAVEVRGPARLDGTAVTGALRGIVVGARGNARIDRAQVASSAVALEITPGSVVRVHDSRLHAPEPIAGGSALEAVGNDLGEPLAPPPLPWLAFAGVTFLFLAVVLQVIHRARNQVLASGRRASRCLAGLE